MFDKLGHGRISRLFQEQLRKTVPYRHRVDHYFWGARGALREHFGPKARIPELFGRRDWVYFALESQKLQWYAPAPASHHDLLDATARVGRVEERVGYIFKHKMYCIEALKQTTSTTPLYFKGIIIETDRNNRLALLGDRVLSLALSELWFYTGNTLGQYTHMSLDTVTRVALNNKGLELKLDENLILAGGVTEATQNQVAETFEAILGAVYLDSGHDVEAVKRVLKTVGLDQNKFLKKDDAIRAEREQKELAALRATEEREREQKSIATSRQNAGSQSQTETMGKDATDVSKITWTSLLVQYFYGAQPQAELADEPEKSTIDRSKRPMQNLPEQETQRSPSKRERMLQRRHEEEQRNKERKAGRAEKEKQRALQKKKEKEMALRRQKEKDIALQKEKEKALQKQKEKEVWRQRELEAQKQTEKEARKQKETEAQKQKETEAQKQKETEAQKQKELKAQKEKEKEMEAQKQKELRAQKEKEKEKEAQKQKELRAQKEKEKEMEAQKQKELKAQKEKELKAQKEKELKAQKEKELKAQKEKEMEAQEQKEPNDQKERETEAQEQTKFEAQEQNDRDQQMLKEPEEQTKYHEPMENENEREREREEQELKAGRQEGEEPLSFGLRRHAWNVAHVKAASLRRKGNKKCERRAKLREQRKIKWAEDTPEDSLEESPKDSSPATAQEETTTASGTPREEEIVAVSVPTQEQAELVEAREPAKSDSSAHNESSPAVRKSIKQIETELIQEHQHAWATAGTGRSEFQSVRRPLNIVRTQRRMLAASIEKLKDKDISTPSEEDNSYQSEVHALSATESEQATAPSSAVSEVVVGVAMRADMMHEERANHQS